MTGPTVVFEIGGTDYGDCVIQADIWQETLNGVGRWEIIADPAGPCAWPAVNTIATDSQIRITIGGVTMMRGYIDDVLPFLDRKGYHAQLYRLTGRNRGMDLAQHQVSGTWINTAADAIIVALLAIIPSELTEVTSAGVPPNIDYEADRTYLADAVRDIANLVDHDFYVDNTNWPANANLRFFPYGSAAEPTGLVLRNFPGAVTNNILHIEPCGEEVGFNIKNYIDAHAGSLEDHYTDLNAADWTPTNCTITDETTIFLNGKGSIKVEQDTGGAAQPIADLTFPRYSHNSLDLEEPCIATYNFLMHDTLNAIRRLRLRLRDTTANEIEFYRNFWGAVLGFTKCRNCTDTIVNDEWRKVDIPIGSECGIEPVGPLANDTKGHWYQFAGAGFNWAAVDRIRFTTTAVNLNDEDYFIIDGLAFPNHEVRSIQQDAASIAAYGQRMKDYYRPDIKNQIELDDYATKMLNQLKDPKETITLVADGQTLTPYAAQRVEVVAPDFGIGGPLITDTEYYRIVRLHHKIVKSSDDSDEPGYTFTTEYDLVRHQYYGTATTQILDHTKLININEPIESDLRNIRLEERYRRRAGKGVRLAP